jgi:hypothetical protein
MRSTARALVVAVCFACALGGVLLGLLAALDLVRYGGFVTSLGFL